MRRLESILESATAVENVSSTVPKVRESLESLIEMIERSVSSWMQASVLDAPVASHTAEMPRLSSGKVVEYKCIYT